MQERRGDSACVTSGGFAELWRQQQLRETTHVKHRHSLYNTGRTHSTEGGSGSLPFSTFSTQASRTAWDKRGSRNTTVVPARVEALSLVAVREPPSAYLEVTENRGQNGGEGWRLRLRPGSATRDSSRETQGL